MKVVKIMFVLLFLSLIGIFGWIYYPQYELKKLREEKQESVKASSHSKDELLTYLEKLRELDKANIKIVALGDSIIAGVGSKETEGFLKPTATSIASSINKNVQVINMGIGGLTSTELVSTMNTNPSIIEQIKDSDVVFLNIGGNDILGSFNKAGNVGETVHAFTQLKSTFETNLNSIVNFIYKENPHAIVVVLELYNPIKPDDAVYEIATQLLPKWNVLFYRMASIREKLLIIETSRALNGKNEELFTNDGIHPNDKGYDAIATQIMLQLEDEKVVAY